MRVEKINGFTVPYNKSTEELEAMLSNGEMNEFVAACEALSYKSDERAFDILRSYITDKDKYKRLCILKTIFRHPMSDQVKGFLEESILSDDVWFAENGLKVVWEYKIPISEKAVLSAVFKHLRSLYCTDLYALEALDVNEDNYSNLIRLFNKSEICGQKEVLCEILCSKYLPMKAVELFELFSSDSFEKIRKIASRKVKEAMKCNYVKIIDIFCKDGYVHIKPECGEYNMIYRAAKGVCWDETEETLYYNGKVSKETALKFISEAMLEEYGIILVLDR